MDQVAVEKVAPRAGVGAGAPGGEFSAVLGARPAAGGRLHRFAHGCTRALRARGDVRAQDLHPLDEGAGPGGARRARRASPASGPASRCQPRCVRVHRCGRRRTSAGCAWCAAPRTSPVSRPASTNWRTATSPASFSRRRSTKAIPAACTAGSPRRSSMRPSDGRSTCSTRTCGA